MGNPVKVLVIQDKEVIRAGLSALMRRQSEIKVCGLAATVEDALQLVRKA